MPDEFAAVAVPLPLSGPLTYRVPEELGVEARVGCRARVQVGKRRLTGIIVALSEERPDLKRILPIEAVLDRPPILDDETLALGRFVSDYYLAPIGETLKALYLKIRPGGRGWTRIVTQIDEDTSGDGADFPQAILAMILGAGAIYGALFATGYFLYGQVTLASVVTAVALACAYGLFRIWPRLQFD